jgi:hypothetical protein
MSSYSWRRSTKCSANGCVEVAVEGDIVAVRDSKQSDGAVLLYDTDEWQAFIAGVKAGEFDLP